MIKQVGSAEKKACDACGTMENIQASIGSNQHLCEKCWKTAVNPYAVFLGLTALLKRVDFLSETVKNLTETVAALEAANARPAKKAVGVGA